MKHTFLPAVIIAALSLNAFAADQPDLSTVQQKFSYAIGIQIGQNLKRQGLKKVDEAALAAAVADVLSGAEPRVPIEDLRAAVKAYQEQMKQEHETAARKNLDASNKFLAANKSKDGVKELPSGLQYEVLKAGNGKQPTAEDKVVVNYRGTLIDGEQFDSSYDRGEPTTLAVNQVIKGWQQALPLMHVGGKYRIWVPPALGYGEHGAGSAIGPNQALVFDIELLDIKQQ